MPESALELLRSLPDPMTDDGYCFYCGAVIVRTSNAGVVYHDRQRCFWARAQEMLRTLEAENARRTKP